MTKPTEAQLRAFHVWAREHDFTNTPPTRSAAHAFAAGWNAIAPPADTEPPANTTCDKCGEPSWWFSDAGYCKHHASRRGEQDMLVIDPDRLTQLIGRRLAALVLAVSGTTTRQYTSGAALNDTEAQGLDLGDPRK